MRKTPMIALGLLASVGMAGGVAVAQQQAPAAPEQDLQISVTPSKAGTKKKPKNSKIKLEVQNNVESKTTVSRIVVSFPKTIKVNTKGFKTCTVSQLEQAGKCPSGSKVGTGGAKAFVEGADGKLNPLNFDVAFYVAPSKALLLQVDQGDDGNLGANFIAKFGSAGGKFGRKLTINIPENLQAPSGVTPYLTELSANLKGTTGKGSKKHGLFESEGCTGGEYDFESELTYRETKTAPNGGKTTAEDESSCSKGR